MEWAVLDWNEPALRFYESLDARQMKEWIIHRLTPVEIARLAAETGLWRHSSLGLRQIRTFAASRRGSISVDRKPATAIGQVRPAGDRLHAHAVG